MNPSDIFGLIALTGVVWLTLFFLFDKTHRSHPSRSTTQTSTLNVDQTP